MHCRDKVADYNTTASHRRAGGKDPRHCSPTVDALPSQPVPAPPPPTVTAPQLPSPTAAPSLLRCRPLPPATQQLVVAPAGFRLPTPAEMATGPTLPGRTKLYYWSGDC